jgi:hypothetical protein
MRPFPLGIILTFLYLASSFGFDRELRDRVLEGDRVALDQIKELPENERAQILYSCLYSFVRMKLQKKHPDIASDLAKEFVAMGSHAEFLRDKLAEHTSGSGRKREAFFEVTSLLRSKEVEEMLAKLTFDDRFLDSPGSLEVGVYSPLNSDLAARALGEMKLVDSPLPEKHPLSYNRSDVDLWRKWAVERMPELNSDVNELDPALQREKVRTPQQNEADQPEKPSHAGPLSLPTWALVVIVLAALGILIRLVRNSFRGRAS